MFKSSACLFLCAVALPLEAALVPFFTDPSYERDELTDPPWFVRNDGQPSRLYHGGVFVSQETGTNDLALEQAWRVQPAGAKVGVVDMGAHGDRTEDLVRTVSPLSEQHRHELARWYAADVAAGVADCVASGCRVVAVTTGFASPDAALSNAVRLAESSNAVVVCAVPNAEGDLDGALADYPYAWRLGNVLGATCTDRNGGHYSPSATGTNAVGAPGRNVVAAGTYSSGSSWSAAILAGCVALLAERYPGQAAAAYAEAFKASAAGPARRVDVLAAMRAPVPALSITVTGVAVRGLPGWRYGLERSDDLERWRPAAGEPFGPGFYRAKILCD